MNMVNMARSKNHTYLNNDIPTCCVGNRNCIILCMRPLYAICHNSQKNHTYFTRMNSKFLYSLEKTKISDQPIVPYSPRIITYI